jgi:hypothetical protein
VSITGHTKSAVEKAIDRIMDLCSQRSDCHSKLKVLRRNVQQLMDDEVETEFALNEDIAVCQDELQALATRIQVAEKSLGVNGRKQLLNLKDHEFLRLRMHARALKSRIRSKIILQKFERDKLERAYRHHVMSEWSCARTNASPYLFYVL